MTALPVSRQDVAEPGEVGGRVAQRVAVQVRQCPRGGRQRPAVRGAERGAEFVQPGEVRVAAEPRDVVVGPALHGGQPDLAGQRGGALG
ncbi:hypothetical protein, partial [Nonomuraea antimicrobica]|uniref:hypothetical protein n=1 Tax=Nonomuraea antimicrobica TaxID=561173 RepID=UPI0031EF072C